VPIKGPKSASITYKVKIKGVDETLKAFRRLPKEANTELRDASREMAGDLAQKIKSAAGREGRQWAILARTVRAKRDRVPVVQAGGLTRLGRNRKPAYKMLFGAEFGATVLHQYRKRTPGNRGYVFFPTAKKQTRNFDKRWNKVAEDIQKRFGED
jgi:hypothetical protein